MHENYSQRLEMQIPQTNAYTALPDIEKNFENFVKRYYSISQNEVQDIIDYIIEDSKLENIICNLPKIISKEFPKCPVKLGFMDYTLPEEIVLQITIKTPFDGNLTSIKKDRITDEIFSNFESPDKYYFLSMEF